MSLYILGRILGSSSGLASVATCVDAVGAALRTAMDEEDAAILAQLMPGDGVAFTIADSAHHGEATGLWLSATDAAQAWHRRQPGAVDRDVAPPDYLAAIAATPLARLMRSLTRLTGYQSLGVALVDGGIHSVWRGTPDEVFMTMAWEWRLPWDLSSNRLYVWSPPV